MADKKTGFVKIKMPEKEAYQKLLLNFLKGLETKVLEDSATMWILQLALGRRPRSSGGLRRRKRRRQHSGRASQAPRSSVLCFPVHLFPPIE
jgi:hypothetical protein